MILLSQCELEINKVEPDIHREEVLLVSHSADSQYNVKEEDQSDLFKFILLKPENKVGKTLQYLQKIISFTIEANKGANTEMYLNRNIILSMNQNELLPNCVQL
jgi:hypothetical protein